jgi:hypothetical protein
MEPTSWSHENPSTDVAPAEHGPRVYVQWFPKWRNGSQKFLPTGRAAASGPLHLHVLLPKVVHVVSEGEAEAEFDEIEILVGTGLTHEPGGERNFVAADSLFNVSKRPTGALEPRTQVANAYAVFA